ncbi:MAG: hypothetical protein ACI8PB_005435 [Desulforhopalus sp.]|jgi:hypothetical protein
MIRFDPVVKEVRNRFLQYHAVGGQRWLKVHFSTVIFQKPKFFFKSKFQYDTTILMYESKNILTGPSGIGSALQ